jgi:hypothetical protein
VSKSNARVLRASEIGEYVFCRRAWWYHYVVGLASANREQMQAGTAKHVEHGQQVQRSDMFRRAALVLFAIAIFFALAFILSAMWSAG